MLKYRFLLNASMDATLGLSHPALAQDAEEPQDRPYQSNEIIVTAQRREETLAEIPLSIQAFSQQQLQASGIDDLPALQLITPGYVADVNNGFTQIYIRGIGNAVFIGADPSVATFIDDVPQIDG